MGWLAWGQLRRVYSRAPRRDAATEGVAPAIMSSGVVSECSWGLAILFFVLFQVGLKTKPVLLLDKGM